MSDPMKGAGRLDHMPNPYKKPDGPVFSDEFVEEIVERALMRSWFNARDEVRAVLAAALAHLPREVYLRGELEPLLALVNEQAEQEGLWCIAENIVEAYLQQELRALHEAVEAVFRIREDTE
jgi:hypothetical protein